VSESKDDDKSVIVIRQCPVCGLTITKVSDPNTVERCPNFLFHKGTFSICGEEMIVVDLKKEGE